MPVNYPYYPNYPTYPNYNPMQNPPTPTPTQNQNQSITWVQGESGAKSYLVASNTSVLLMDSEQSRFYIKSTDASGMPMPLRIFEYQEIKDEQTKEPQVVQNNNYVTHEELEERLKDLVERPKSRKAGDNDAKSAI